jgi:hypothetical protein
MPTLPMSGCIKTRNIPAIWRSPSFGDRSRRRIGYRLHRNSRGRLIGEPLPGAFVSGAGFALVLRACACRRNLLPRRNGMMKASRTKQAMAEYSITRTGFSRERAYPSMIIYESTPWLPILPPRRGRAISPGALFIYSRNSASKTSQKWLEYFCKTRLTAILPHSRNSEEVVKMTKRKSREIRRKGPKMPVDMRWGGFLQK